MRIYQVQGRKRRERREGEGGGETEREKGDDGEGAINQNSTNLAVDLVVGVQPRPLHGFLRHTLEGRGPRGDRGLAGRRQGPAARAAAATRAERGRAR